MESLPDILPSDPVGIAHAWLEEAMARQAVPNPNSIALATNNADGAPSVRIVLCKALVANPGYIVFFTNYESAKSIEIEHDSRVAGVFHFDHQGRQVRIVGRALRSPIAESDAYFATRDMDSRVGAWASRQSQPLESRQWLLNQHQLTARALGAVDAGSTIARPVFWGGYRLWIEAIELWLQGDARLHDRARWDRNLGPAGPEGFMPGPWHAGRLQP